MQNEIKEKGPLLDQQGKLANIGWARYQNLDCNLENANFYQLKFLQRFRIKRWDYYAVFTPGRFFSATIADLGYAGNIFVYTIDFDTHELHEEGIVIPWGKGIILPRNSTEGNAHYSNKNLSLDFTLEDHTRKLSVSWPGFHDNRGIEAEINLTQPEEHELINIVIPIGSKRFTITARSTACQLLVLSVMAILMRCFLLRRAWDPWIGVAGFGNIPVFGSGPALRDSWRMGGRSA